jgi:hypothetical protein
MSHPHAFLIAICVVTMDKFCSYWNVNMLQFSVSKLHFLLWYRLLWNWLLMFCVKKDIWKLKKPVPTCLNPKYSVISMHCSYICLFYDIIHLHQLLQLMYLLYVPYSWWTLWCSQVFTFCISMLKGEHFIESCIYTFLSELILFLHLKITACYAQSVAKCQDVGWPAKVNSWWGSL